MELGEGFKILHGTPISTFLKVGSIGGVDLHQTQREKGPPHV